MLGHSDLYFTFSKLIALPMFLFLKTAILAAILDFDKCSVTSLRLYILSFMSVTFSSTDCMHAILVYKFNFHCFLFSVSLKFRQPFSLPV